MVAPIVACVTAAFRTPGVRSALARTAPTFAERRPQPTRAYVRRPAAETSTRTSTLRMQSTVRVHARGARSRPKLLHSFHEGRVRSGRVAAADTTDPASAQTTYASHGTP